MLLVLQLIEKQIGKERRLQVAAIRQREAEEKAREEAKKQAEERKRRPSRFQVVPAPDILQKQLSENHLDQHQVIPTVTQNFTEMINQCQPIRSTLTPQFLARNRRNQF